MLCATVTIMRRRAKQAATSSAWRKLTNRMDPPLTPSEA
jgi:hypothetical protein